MIADLFDVKETDKYGKGEFNRKGVFARQFIPKGTFVYFYCKKCRPWRKEELARLSKDELRATMERDYPIKYCDERLLYNNHSCNANVMDLGNRVSIVVRNIKKGEEQTEDYRIFSDDVHFKNGCKCGEQNCMKENVYTPPPSKELQTIWTRKINSALRLASSVNQPLKTQLLKEHPELAPFFDKSRKNQRLIQIEESLRKLRAMGPAGLTADQKRVFGLTKKGFTYVG